MGSVAEQKGQHEWGYTQKDTLQPDQFLKEVTETMRQKDILSVGEYYDENQDPSFGWISKHEEEILEAYSWYRFMTSGSPTKTPPKFQCLLHLGSNLMYELAKENTSFEELSRMHVGRLFAVALMPLAARLGYTDIVLEGVSEYNPGSTIKRSKDKTGDLLRITAAMMVGMRIHGAIPDVRFETPTDIADTLFSKAKAAKDSNPNARVIIYNGAAHNMTEPFWSYSPKACELYGSKYGVIDLINGDRELPDSHFKYMQQLATKGITRFSHGIDQKTYVFK